ncbi:MAG: GAF domain-containing sensor histidine kinase [Gemmatimonadota bacterium]|nr:GAF domain-containing sensor histidine kinase [Gemmatimonadota bacterium]
MTGSPPAPAAAFGEVMERMASAFALTRGRDHILTYANAAFRTLLGANATNAIGHPIVTVLAPRVSVTLPSLLDRAFRTGIAVQGQRIDEVAAIAYPLACSIWPSLTPMGDTQHLLIELRQSTRAENTLALQREVAERLLVSALREQQAAADAEVTRVSATFLAVESKRLGESLDEGETNGAIARTRLAHVGGWCIVDILAPDHTMHRLAVIHPDPEKQAILSSLEGRWIPEIDDTFGLPAILRDPVASEIAVDLESAFAGAGQPPEVVAALKALGAGSSLTVPMTVDTRLIGTVTFVDIPLRRYTANDIELAHELAARSATALDRARRYGESIAMRIRAESASVAKSTFLGMMSHELRTPLNAIAGYVDILDMGLRGPITEEQRTDLGRIRENQRYLTGLINDLLSLTKVEGGQVVYVTGDLSAQEVMDATRSLVAPLMAQRHLSYDDTTCEEGSVARGDRGKVVQILVNLVSNAIKFTAPGGSITVACTTTEQTVTISVSDTGIGIPAGKLELIFDPFVQIDAGHLSAEAGVGLGLAISRSLARAMHGDVTAESTPGEGARFMLTLPRANSIAARFPQRETPIA